MPKSLAYGPTKAALINLAEALYLDLATQGVSVSLINPGFVETPLTAHNAFHMPALQTPEQAAEAVLDSIPVVVPREREVEAVGVRGRELDRLRGEGGAGRQSDGERDEGKGEGAHQSLRSGGMLPEVGRG